MHIWSIGTPSRAPVILWGALALVSGCGGSNAVGAETTAEVVSTPSAATILRGMATRLEEAPALTFDAVRRTDPELVAGGGLEVATISIAIRRPNELYATAQNEDTIRRFYFDGQQLTIYDEATHYYAEVEIPGTLDTLVAELDERFGFVPPLADFIVNDPYLLMAEQVQTGQYLGTEILDGEPCHHVEVSGALADAELWVGVESRLPRRLVAVYRAVGRPRLRVDFANWNLDAALSDEMFAFEPPEGAVEVELLPAPEVEVEVEEARR